jgi:hypothetical protein
MEGAVGLLAFGKPHDWALRPYNGEVSENALRNDAVSLYLPSIASSFGLGKMLYAPSPRLSNGEICTESDAMKRRYHIRSERYHDSVWLDRGADADGLLLGSKHVYAVSPAGCPILVLRHRHAKLLGVAHTGMRSIIDEGRLKGEPPRRNESVVISLVGAMMDAGVRHAAHLEAVIAFPIDPQVFTYPWDHAVYGELNRKRTEELVSLWGKEAILNYADPVERRLGRPDLAAIIRSQLLSLGVPEENISVLEAPDKSVWHDTRQGNGNSPARNLVLVQHLS